VKFLNKHLNLYKEEYKINLKEGLIKTTPIEKSINLIKKQYPNIQIIKEKNNTFYISLENNFDIINNLIKLCDNLGWFPSYYEALNINGEEEGPFIKNNINISNLKIINIFFEAKFDLNVIKIPKILYHITDSIYLDKIKQKGLIPKSKSKLSIHPDRIYFSKNINAVKLLLQKFNELYPEKDFIILEINTEKIPIYFRLYEDPNFSGYGFYTLNNIPPNAIENL
jgi:hypothetical protein